MSTPVGSAVISIDPPDAHVIATGELDLATAPTLNAQLSEAVSAGCRAFLVDLADVSFCDASTVGVFVRLDRRLRASGGSLRIVAASRCVRRVFDVVGLGHLLDAVDSFEAGALA